MGSPAAQAVGAMNPTGNGQRRIIQQLLRILGGLVAWGWALPHHHRRHGADHHLRSLASDQRLVRFVLRVGGLPDDGVDLSTIPRHQFPCLGAFCRCLWDHPARSACPKDRRPWLFPARLSLMRLTTFAV